MHIAHIVAYDRQRIIGINNTLPWRVPNDMQHFKRTTWGHHVLMGRNTFESLQGKPLVQRVNMVLSSNPNYRPERSIHVSTLAEAIAIARYEGEQELFIIGGGILFEQTLSICTRLYITELDMLLPVAPHDTVTYYPTLVADEWTMKEETFLPADIKNPCTQRYMILERKQGSR